MSSATNSGGGGGSRERMNSTGSAANIIGHVRKKSITSGISTLFRRQPTPDPYAGNVASGGEQGVLPPSNYAAVELSAAGVGASVTNTASVSSTAVTNKARASAQETVVSDPSLSFQPTSSSYETNDDDEYHINNTESSFDDSLGASGSVSSASDRGRHAGRGGGKSKGTKKKDRNRSRSNSAGKSRNTRSTTAPRLPRRYRGFSTSISSLFLDESIVCGALSCCGLLLSSRTEHLLNERNVKRGLTRRGQKAGGSRAPSRILGISLVVTILMICGSFVIWGFTDNYEDYNGAGYDYDNGGKRNGGGNNNKYDDGYNANNNAMDDAVQGANNANYDDAAAAAGDDAVANDDAASGGDDDAVANDDAAAGGGDDIYNRKLVYSDFDNGLSTSTKRHNFNGIMKIRDYQEHVIEPVFGVVNSAYVDLMSQFEEDEYAAHSIDGRRLEKENRNHQFHQQQQRHLQDNSSKDIGAQVRTLVIVCFLFMLGVVGRRRRMRTRFAILRSRAQDDHLYYASLLTNPSGSLATPDGTLMENFHEREDKYDGACSHTLFGCYPVDNQSANYADYLESGNEQQQQGKLRKGGDFMNRTMNTIFSCCCGVLCKCWCQVCSVCALAQEARETRLLLPPKMQRIDLITHQPFHEYANEVNNVRRRFMERASRTWYQHYSALSQLSRYILIGFAVTVVLVTVTLLVHPRGSFTWADAVVLLATFGQSFLVLTIVFGIFHRSDLSFDAVVKFFAVGFVICVPVGFVIEGLLINGLVAMLYVVYYSIRIIAGESFDVWIINNHHLLWVIGELVNAFLVAALVEELCKYYGFRFIEHPDLLFLTGLDRSAEQAQVQGGIDSYKYDSQIVSDFSRSQESDCGNVDSRDRRRKKLNQDGDDEEDPDLRTLRQQAAAITTGMISVAVGLACAENFLYVFFLGGTGGDMGAVTQEFAILLFRSIFPVHALAAAMQSINMIKKFIEEKHGGTDHIGVGKVILPAVLLHGTFDAILMSITAYIESSWDNFYEKNDDYEDGFLPYNPIIVNACAWVGIIGVMIVSFGWYTYQNQVQMIKLMRIEQKNQSRSKQNNFNTPELV